LKEIIAKGERVMSKPIEITDANFEEEVINSEVPVLIDFWAIWCGPCKVIAPVVEEIASEYEGKIKVGKLDVDHNPNSAVQYGIRSIPTLLIFNDGKVSDQLIGALPKAQIVERVQKVLSN
jgi:thioredoxin 1